jgi:hypothetical protein
VYTKRVIVVVVSLLTRRRERITRHPTTGKNLSTETMDHWLRSGTWTVGHTN